MVVALGAVDRHAQERHRYRFGQLRRILVQHEEVRRAVFQRAAGGRHQVAGELVPRRVGRHVVANPVIVGPHRRRPQLLAVDQQQVAPLVGPIVDKLRPRQQLLDQLVALVGRRIGQKRAGLLDRGQQADRVDIRPPQKLGVGGRRRWRQVQVLQLRQHQLVDEVAPRGFGKHVGRELALIADADRGDHVPTQVPGLDRRLAVPGHLHQPGRADLGHRFVGRGELGPARDVFGMAVGEVGPHDQLLPGAGLEHRGARQDFEAIQPRVVIFRSRGARRRSTRKSHDIRANRPKTAGLLCAAPRRWAWSAPGCGPDRSTPRAAPGLVA